MLPLRAPPALAATAKATEPLPVPLAPLVIVIQGASAMAFHVQALLVLRASDEVPPVAAASYVDGLMV